jgi:ribosomal protein S2
MTDTSNIEKKVEELFNLGAHLGHRKNRVHPKAKKFIYKIENQQSIIDLNKTVVLLEKAKKFFDELGEKNKTILFVATKKNIANFIEKICHENNFFYLTNKWPPGFLTNFETFLKNNIQKMQKMREEKEKGEWEKFVKHERESWRNSLEKLKKFTVVFLRWKNCLMLYLLLTLNEKKMLLLKPKNLIFLLSPLLTLMSIPILWTILFQPMMMLQKSLSILLGN